MKNIHIPILLLLLFCTAVLTACQTTSDTATPAPTYTQTGEAFVPYTLQYTVTDLTDQLPSHPAMADGPALEERYLLCAYTKDGTLWMYYDKDDAGNPAPRLIPLRADGTVDTEHTLAVPMTNPNAAPRMAYAFGDGRFCQLYTSVLGTTLCVTDESGAVLSEHNVTDDFQTNFIAWELEFLFHSADDGALTVVLSVNRIMGTECVICHYDTSSDTWQVQTLDGLGMNDHIAFWKPLDGSRYLTESGMVIDTEDGTYTESAIRLPHDIYNRNVTRLRGDDGRYYIGDVLSLRRYNDNLAPTAVLDFTACGIEMDALLRNLRIIDDHTFFTAEPRTVDGKASFRICHIRAESVPDTDTRKVILFDLYAKDTWLVQSIARFNRENTDYRVKTRLISGTEEELKAHLEENMLFDAHPDMMLVSGYDRGLLDRYYDKNVFLDLAPQIGDRVLGCVAEGNVVGDALYALPLVMWLETFVSAADTVDGFLSWTEFYDMIDHLDADAHLTSDPLVGDIIYRNGIMDFFDKTTGTASYDTPAFRDMITYTDALTDVTDPDAGLLTDTMSGLIPSYHLYTNPTLPAQMKAGRLKLLNVGIHNPTNLFVLQELFGEGGFVFCGYPSQKGGGAYLQTDLLVSLLADSSVTDGCLAFLAFLLSDEMQSAEAHRNLPVTDSGMRAFLDRFRYAYYDTVVYENHRSAHPEINNQTSFRGETVDGVMISPAYLLPAPVDSETHFPVQHRVFADGTMQKVTYEEVFLSDRTVDDFLYFLNHCHMKANTDQTVLAIVTEELSAFRGGVGTLEDATRAIQSRVQIYLNE